MVAPVIPVAIVCCIFIAFGALFTLFTIARRKDDEEIKQNLAVYEDDDGVATPETIAAFSDLVPRLTLAASSIAGLIASIGLLYGRNDRLDWTCWISVAAWVVVLIQIAALHGFKSPVLRFNVGLSLAIQVAVITAYSLYNGYDDLEENTGVIVVAQAFFGFSTWLAAVSIPRRPDVERDGKIVDGMFTVSAFERYTIAWGRRFLDQALKSQINYEDIALLDASMLVTNLHSRYRRAVKSNPGRHLLLTLFQANRNMFLRLWGITLLECLANFAPQVCMYRILRELERRDAAGGSLDKAVWFWILGLGIAKCAYLEFNGWVSLIRWGIIPQSIKSQLSAVLFDKSLLMEDKKQVETVGGTDEGKQSIMDHNTDTTVTTYETTPLLGKGGSNTAIVDETPKSGDQESNEATQNATNLITVAVAKVATFASMSFMIETGTIDTALGVLFLTKLIGLWATLGGLLIVLLAQPLSTWVTNNYTSAEDEVMDAREKKSEVVSEMLHGVKMIKISSTEAHWKQKILAARNKEMRSILRLSIFGLALEMTWLTMPVLFSTTSLGIYAYLNGGINAATAFTALSVFSGLEQALVGVPLFITTLQDALVSSKRIMAHLQNRDQPDYRVKSQQQSVTFKDATISWPSDEPDTFKLRLNLEFPAGSLSVIHGKTGCGKTLLLAAILGEARVLSGTLTVPSPSYHPDDEFESLHDSWMIKHSMAYVAQIPWLEDASVKQNIQYGLPFDQSRYDDVLDAAALVKDLEILPDGDNTELGSSGVNLSGGQKWRVSFARALYSRADILVMDDIFSAVDAHVGRHIFERGLCGKLAAGRTRILVTHHIGLVLNAAAYVVEIDRNGKARGVNAASYSGPSSGSMTPEAKADILDAEEDDPPPKKEEERVAAKFVEEEHREEGRVSFAVYLAYIKASGGYIAWLFLLFSFAIFCATTLTRSWWVSKWAGDADEIANKPEDLGISKNNHQDTVFYLLVYLGISLLTVVLTAVKVGTVLLASLRASRVLFRSLTDSVLQAKVRWLDTTPTGRILNRFIGDFEKVDDEISHSISQGAHFTFVLIGVVVADVYVSVWSLIPSAMLVLSCIWIARMYISGARDVRRLESNSKSPVLEHYTSSLAGLATIRGFGKREEYVQKMYDYIDKSARTEWIGHVVIGWMEFRQGFLGILFAVVVACGVVVLPGIGAPLAGFALSFALEFAWVVVEAIIRYSQIELSMNAIERVDEYVSMPHEPTSGTSVPANWPSAGLIEIKDLTVAYDIGLPPVLHSLTFTAEPTQSIGVVGRTGAGKSSLTLAIFRMLDIRAGSITIDGIDTSTITLHDLRSRLAIIPQDPVLFSGTLRSNIDPLEQYTDEEVFAGLRRMHLLDEDEEDDEEPAPLTLRKTTTNTSAIVPPPTRAVFHDLSYPISRGGLNLSQGQRQLICLARALISRPKVLILDESTSNLDMATDRKIQRSIREDFAQSTLLVIAHRLSTIADFDKVLVLDKGEVKEFGKPKVLWEMGGGFRDMVQSSGEREGIEAMFRA